MDEPSSETPNTSLSSPSPAARPEAKTRWWTSRYQTLNEKYGRYGPAVFFIAGFLFDVVTLGRIDDPLTITQQGLYLLLLALILILEARDFEKPYVWPERIRYFWNYRDEVSQFLYGSLLSAYTLFYFKSASFVTSFAFILVLAAVMIANESSRFRRLGPLMRFGLLSLCLSSYLAYVVPIFLGFIGFFPFLLAILLASAMMAIVHRAIGPVPWRDLFRFSRPLPHPPIESVTQNESSSAAAPDLAKIRWLSPRVSFGVQILFVLMYLLQIVPPVPLSALYMGIYHKVEKREGHYVLSYDRPEWKFWQNGAQTFLARPGDRIYVFARIFSPTRFHDEIRVRWLYDDEKRGWQSSDAIPIAITGGRDEGFRGFAFKQNYTPGRWRVQLETRDGREIGRIGFDVEPALNPNVAGTNQNLNQATQQNATADMPAREFQVDIF